MSKFWKSFSFKLRFHIRVELGRLVLTAKYASKSAAEKLKR